MHSSSSGKSSRTTSAPFESFLSGEGRAAESYDDSWAGKARMENGLREPEARQLLNNANHSTAIARPELNQVGRYDE